MISRRAAFCLDRNSAGSDVGLYGLADEQVCTGAVFIYSFLPCRLLQSAHDILSRDDAL
jgi:hypothetical protein